MYKNLAEAIESLKEKGIENLFTDNKDEKVVDKYLEDCNRMKILACYEFEAGTNPGDESSVYVIETPEGENKYVVLSYGSYANPHKTKLIDTILQKNEPK